MLIDAVPVRFVTTPLEGVPSAGVTRVGLVAKTTLPEPVVVAAEIAVPLPERIPVMLVVSVIAGVEVAVATVPANPLVVTTETDVTVPVPPGVPHVPSPRQNVVPEAPVPELRLVVGRFPTTPVESGSPVAFVRTPAVGVPRFGVMSAAETNGAFALRAVSKSVWDDSVPVIEPHTAELGMFANRFVNDT